MDYGAVNFEKYKYLEKYLEEKGKYATFRTKGLSFFHYVKVRSKSDMKNFKDLFIEEIFEVDKTDTETMKGIVGFPDFNKTTTITGLPVFEEKPLPVPDYKDLGQIFGDIQKANDKSPFD